MFTLDSQTSGILLISSLLLVSGVVWVLVYAIRTRTLASPVALFSLVVGLHYALPGLLMSVFGAPFVSLPANYDYITHAQWLVLFSWCAFVIGARIAKLPASTLTGSSTPEARITWSSRGMFIATTLLWVVGWSVRAYIVTNEGYFQIDRAVMGQLEGNFYAAVRMIELFPLHVLYMLSIWVFMSRNAANDATWLRLLAVVFFFEFVYWLPTGRKEETIYVLLMPIFIKYLAVGRLPRWPVMIGALAFIALLFPLSHVYRNAMELLGTGSTAVRTVQESVAGAHYARTFDDLDIYEVGFARLSLLEPVAACIRLIESESWPISNGTSYVNVVLSIVPRFLWPGKPDFHFGNDFGYAAGFISQGDVVTSISVTFVGESYLNFSWFGIVVSGFIGFIFQSLYHQAVTSTRRMTWTLLYVVSVPTLLFVGGTFALYYGGLLKILPFYFLVCTVISLPKRRGSSATTFTVDPGR